ncbi:efflux RND transporter periplasmic adaptor subunit [Leptospira idonii]|uniref:Efflux RND transporter periplasmic adaptor subunit n=1 Tax=Leptospira idonii TaxID=1193500 RepID=A0A4R9M096_9LEPT|nr:efflux RND transporter periplasmic adaptor subunit [Leptospira idonii]TGN19341.1 efflux RND transporter periplasmic adaptor subunit [Leptospira idonii]
MKITISKKHKFHYGMFLFLLYVLFQLGFRFYRYLDLKKETKEMAMPTVSIVQPKPLDEMEFLNLPGTIKAWNEAPLFSQVSGYVKVWHKDYGAEVQTGTVLAEIQVPVLDAEYSKAKSELDAQEAKYRLAEVTAKRYLSLQKTNAVSDQAISEVLADQGLEKAKWVAMQNNWQKWQSMIRFKKIIAPFAGVVTQRNINIGDYVNQEGNLSDPKNAAPLFVVADVHKLRLFVSVPSTFSFMLKKGLTCTVNLPEFPDKNFTAHYLTISKGFDPSSQTVLAEFELPNPKGKILPGSYAQVNLGSQVSSPLLTIPASSIFFEGENPSIVRLDSKNRVHFSKIEINRVLDQTVEIKTGVASEDKIVDYPRTTFAEGDLVRIVKPRKGY